MIDTIIFDIGRVLVKFEWEEYLSSFSFDQKTFSILGNAMFKSPTWSEFDRGALSDEEILSRFVSSAPGYEKEIRTVFEAFPSCLSELPHTIPWLTSLKERGYRIFYLSNFAKTTREKAKEALAFMNLCDGGLMSYEVNLVKPDPAFYQELFCRYHIDPKHAVFFDDSETNVTAGATLGLNAILFTDYESASLRLEELLS